MRFKVTFEWKMRDGVRQKRTTTVVAKDLTEVFSDDNDDDVIKKLGLPDMSKDKAKDMRMIDIRVERA